MATPHRPIRRVPVRTAAPRRPVRLTDRALRLILLAFVVAGASALFALALLPSIGAAAGGIERFSSEFQTLGKDVDIRIPKPVERSTIYAANGAVLATLYLDENRKVVEFENVTDHMKDAVVAIEDERFYEHPGLDARSIIRALVTNVSTGGIQQGASTLTQQLARNSFPEVGTERTLARKVAEAKVAMRIEDRYSKDQILEFYLNEVYFGRSVYGIGAAAEFYFGKNVGKLTLSESAMLAGLIQAPERYSPVVDEDAARERRDFVLNRMAELGYITEQEAAEAKEAELGVVKNNVVSKRRFPFFVEFVRQEIMDVENETFSELGETRRQRNRALFQGGLHIHTTLEPRLQKAGDKIGRDYFPQPQDPESAVAAVQTNNGAIRALSSSARFRQSQVNLASGQGGSGRQSGSAAKIFTLVAAFEKGIPPQSIYDGANGQIVDCTPFGPPDYRAVNADGGGGKMDLWAATARSVNAVFVNLAVDVGVNNVVEVANRMGIKSQLPEVCSVTLGTGEVTPLEMAGAISTLANDGVHCEPHAVALIKDRNGDEIANQEEGRCEEVVDPKIAALTVNLLKPVVQNGTGRAANLGRWPAFGKTGSTNNLADAWFAGCTKQICSASWVGHTEGLVPMFNVNGVRVFGGTYPAQIWRDFMMVAMEGKPAIDFPGVPKISWPKQKVPDVVGKQQEQAVEILGEAGFGSSVNRVPSTEPEGTVISQSPAGGSKVTLGTSVALEVSSGKAPRARVPDVVSMKESTAIKTLRNAGFGVAVSYEKTGQKNLNGIVKSQSPGARKKAKEGATVRITVYDYKKPQPKPSPSPPDD